VDALPEFVRGAFRDDGDGEFLFAVVGLRATNREDEN
jgi:hypothetical protein